jgi:Domain of unknown function (DUF4258)
MNLKRVRQLLAQGKVELRFADHAVIEARKDGLVGEDLESAATKGEALEDYGSRALLLSFTKEDRLPCHVVLEYVPGTQEVVIVTAYIPDAKEWEPDWKRRRRKKRR